jgi:hypothetical protein
MVIADLFGVGCLVAFPPRLCRSRGQRSSVPYSSLAARGDAKSPRPSPIPHTIIGFPRGGWTDADTRARKARYRVAARAEG